MIVCNHQSLIISQYNLNGLFWRLVEELVGLSYLSDGETMGDQALGAEVAQHFPRHL